MPRSQHVDCRCPERRSDDGLLDYTVDCDHYEQLAAALKAIAEKPTATLRVLTFDPEPSPDTICSLDDVRPCDGSMTCPCDRCRADRSAAVRRGVRPSEPIPVRRRIAA